MLARGGAFTLWRYESADAPADLLGAGYFLPAGGILRRGDLIVCADPAPAGRRTALLVVEASPARVSLESLQSQAPSSLAALTDVELADPTPEEVLTFSDGRWSNRPAAGRAGDAHAALPGNPHGASAADVGAVAASERGRPGGVATLDDDGRLSVQQLRQVALAGLRDVLADNPRIGDVLRFDGAAWRPEAEAGAAGDAFAASHAGSAGTAAHAPATASEAGFMAAADKQKLDRIEPGATADQTGAELVSAIDAELGSGDWRQDASAWGEFHGKSLGSALVDKAGAIDVDVASVVASLPQTRAISAPAGEDPSIKLELPAAVDRRDFLLAFSATGAVTTTKVATAADMDALVARGLITVENIAALRKLRPSSNDAVVYVRGHTTPGDGGEGIFRWDPADDRKMVTTVSLIGAGSAYIPGAELIIKGGAGKAAVVMVTAVDTAGAITSFSLLDPGCYTAAPAVLAAIDTQWGAGASFQFAFAEYDNGGTVLAHSQGGKGRWVRNYSGAVSVRWFGARGDGKTIDHTAFTAALAASDTVFVPAGTYAVDRSIVLREKSTLAGEALPASVIHGTKGFDDPLVRTYPVVRVADAHVGQGAPFVYARNKQVTVRDISLAGWCKHGLQIVRGTGSLVENIHLRAATSSHGFVWETAWNAVMRNCRTFGAVINPQAACLFVGRDMNAFSVYDFATSNVCRYGILHTNGYLVSDGVGGHGVLYSNICLQGHTETALYIRNNGYGGTVVNNLYTEACKESIKLGDRVARSWAKSVAVAGGIFQSCPPDNPGIACIALDYALSVSFTGCEIHYQRHRAAFYFHSARNITIYGCNVGAAVEMQKLFIRAEDAERINVFGTFRSEDGKDGTCLLMAPADTWNHELMKVSITASGTIKTSAAPVPAY